MHHPFPKLLKGNYPFAVLHAFRTMEPQAVLDLTRKLSEEEMSEDEAAEYIKAVVKTNGNPQILDLIEAEKEGKPGPGAYLKGPRDPEYLADKEA